MDRKTIKIFLISIALSMVILAVAVFLLMKNANVIIKNQLESRLGKGFSVKSIDLCWGSVEVGGITLKDPSGTETIKIERLKVKADFMGILKKEYIISSLAVERPYILIETDRNGKIIRPALPVAEAPEDDKEPKAPEKLKEPSPPIHIKKIVIKEGSCDFLDGRQTKPPVVIKTRDIDLAVQGLVIPFGDEVTHFDLSAAIPGPQGKGYIRGNGHIALKTKDGEGRLEARGLDITGFKPYYQKKSPVSVRKGLLDMTVDVKVESERINAPGKMALKNLYLDSGFGRGSMLLGIPASSLISFMKNNRDELEVSFVVTGNLNDPKFNLTDTFMVKITHGIAEKLGIPFKTLGDSAASAGSDGVNIIEKGLKGIGITLKKGSKK